jgi:hypothetical protein
LERPGFRGAFVCAPGTGNDAHVDRELFYVGLSRANYLDDVMALANPWIYQPFSRGRRAQPADWNAARRRALAETAAQT